MLLVPVLYCILISKSGFKCVLHFPYTGTRGSFYFQRGTVIFCLYQIAGKRDRYKYVIDVVLLFYGKYSTRPDRLAEYSIGRIKGNSLLSMIRIPSRRRV